MGLWNTNFVDYLLYFHLYKFVVNILWVVKDLICCFSNFGYSVWKWHHIEYYIVWVGPKLIQTNPNMNNLKHPSNLNSVWFVIDWIGLDLRLRLESVEFFSIQIISNLIGFIQIWFESKVAQPYAVWWKMWDKWDITTKSHYLFKLLWMALLT